MSGVQVKPWWAEVCLGRGRKDTINTVNSFINFGCNKKAGSKPTKGYTGKMKVLFGFIFED